jgi:tRNA threonylcarbamoyladenosine biosynthesis protein TsaE
MQIETRNPAQTAALGALVAARAKRGDTLFLNGPLGAGKTVFARAFIRARMKDADAEVPSPTFSLVQVYEGPKGDRAAPVYHFDLYRLKDAEEIFELGWEEAQGAGIALVEWAERLGGLAPAERLEIDFATGALEETRIINFTGWADRLAGLDKETLT